MINDSLNLLKAIFVRRSDRITVEYKKTFTTESAFETLRANFSRQSSRRWSGKECVVVGRLAWKMPFNTIGSRRS